MRRGLLKGSLRVGVKENRCSDDALCIFFNFKPHFLFMPPLFIEVFENHRKSLIQHCERSELRLHFECSKVENAKNGQFGERLKT